MKKLLVLTLALSSILFTANAQHKREHKMGGKKQKHAQLAKQLNLSEEQKKQAQANKAEFKQKMQELNKNESITVKEQRDRKEVLRKEQKAKMQAMLTPEQKTKMAELKAAKKAKHEEKFAQRLNKMKSKLNLTDAQIAQLKSQRESIKTRAKAIKDNEGLSRTQRKEQLTALKADAKAQKSKIFTAEQLKQLDEMKKNKMNRKQTVK
jgi:Spy/CpxP family protein refolding chaperone